jgi:hypothetical protein
MYSLGLKTVDKVVYRRENSSLQAKPDHDKLRKFGPIRSDRFQLWSSNIAVQSSLKLDRNVKRLIYGFQTFAG